MSLVEKISFKMMSFYHETLYSLFRDPHAVLKKAGLEKGQKVLEVGCGPGFFTVPAADIVGPSGSLHVIDINPYAVEHVQKKIDASGMDNIELSQSDASDMGVDSGSFNNIFVFGLARAKGEGFDAIWPELHRVLKEDGVLAIEGRIKPPEKLFRPEKNEGRIARFAKTP